MGGGMASGTVGNVFGNATPTSSGYGRGSSTVPVTAGGGRKGMSLGSKSRKNESLLESLRAEGEVVDESPAAMIATGGGSGVGMNANAAAVAAYAAAACAPSSPVQLSTVEKINVTVNRDGGIQNLEVKGDLLLRVTDPSCACIRVSLSSGDAEARGIQFRTHPNVDRTLFATQHLIGLKDSSKPFPTTQVSSNPIAVLRWRYVSKDETAAPILINCWPSDTGSESTVNIEYDLGSTPSIQELRNVVINVPIGSSSQPTVSHCDGEFVYNARSHSVEWQIAAIDSSNRSGSLEFTTALTDASAFFPVKVSFLSKQTYSQIQVSAVAYADSGLPVDFSYDSSLVPESFSIV